MRLFARFLLVALALSSLASCADLGIPNPFQPTSDVNDIYISQFPDIPIPSDMRLNAKNTLITPAPDGAKSGLATYAGRVESVSLANAMLHNMTGRGWTPLGSVSGKRTTQVYEKDQRLAVIYIYEQTLDTALEVWMLNRQTGGAAFSTGLTAPSGAGPASAARASGASGGVQARPLAE